MTADSNPDQRQALELAQTAKARFETTEAAAQNQGLDLERIAACSQRFLDDIHAGPCQQDVMWVLEIASAMLTAVMAVNGESLPISSQVDPASYAMSVLRDLQTAAQDKGLEFSSLEAAAAEGLRQADADDYSHSETYWALNRATASVELGWARSLVDGKSV